MKPLVLAFTLSSLTVLRKTGHRSFPTTVFILSISFLTLPENYLQPLKFYASLLKQQKEIMVGTGEKIGSCNTDWLKAHNWREQNN